MLGEVKYVLCKIVIMLTWCFRDVIPNTTAVFCVDGLGF